MLLDAIAQHGFDACLGGARRDDEKARAKERVFPFRDEFGQWNPKNSRAVGLYNGRIRKSEHIRAFPISNWTELDIWQDAAREPVEVPWLYFAHRWTVGERDGMLLAGKECIEPPRRGAVRRHRALPHGGDLSCTAAIESAAATVEEITRRGSATRITKRRASRADNHFLEASMEDRKADGQLFNDQSRGARDQL